MQPLAVVLTKIKQAYDSGSVDTSCYNRVGRVLRVHGDELGHAVVALYGLSPRYAHAAIESLDGTLIDERRAPPGFRSSDGRCARTDIPRAVLSVAEVLQWLRTS